MKSAFRGCVAAAALIAFSSSWIWSQTTRSDKPPAAKESIGDAVQAEDKVSASHSGEGARALAQPVASPP
ncbi:MAG TPA: hypothetical protein VFJ56_01260, partial [Nitrospira sp.]|nr:hypothetical protein [Nitrospira sp.]